MLSSKELEQQIVATAELLDLGEYVIEKDYYLTKAIENIATIENENYRLVFQGGTSLAKAHNIINRMSEDSDFRIELINQAIPSKEKKRKLLREFRKEIIASLINNGFEIDKKDIRVINEGRFMSIKVSYPSQYESDRILKPYLAMDFFLGHVKMPTTRQNITTLIQKALKNKVNHSITEIECISIVETAAEKWVALTRRIAGITHKETYYDPNLVRHLYDIYHINEAGLISDDFFSLAKDIIEYDRKMFKNHNDDYFNNPISEISRSLKQLKSDNSWKNHWDDFIDAMVFDKSAPSYDTALDLFCALSDKIIKEEQR